MTRSFKIIAKWGLTGMVALLAVGSSLRPASAEVTLFTVDSGTLSADRTEVTLTGTIVCTNGDSVSIIAYVDQTQGRVVVRSAGGTTNFGANGTVQTWIVTTSVQPDLKYKPGPAVAVSFIYTSGVNGFTSQRRDQRVALHR
jgi:hypothetical protein